jgi:hypothetical protein
MNALKQLQSEKYHVHNAEYCLSVYYDNEYIIGTVNINIKEPSEKSFNLK